MTTINISINSVPDNDKLFVKWMIKKYAKNPRSFQLAVARCYASLVRRHREGNRMKQEIVAQLGGISIYENTDGTKSFASFRRKVFRFHVRKILEKLKIPSRLKKKVWKSLSLKIPLLLYLLRK